MAVIETKFSVGDVVWHAGTTTQQKQHPCPDCKGDREWKAVSPAGDEFSFACPRCATSYISNRDLSLSYTAHVPTARKLTIGSVRYDSNSGTFGDETPASYMCLETGVGGGSVYREDRLFETEAEALEAAETLARKSNTEIEWVAKQFDKSLEISDYQLSNAALHEAKKGQSRASEMLWNLRDLFATIEEADDKDAILEAVADYRARDWKRDIAKARGEA